MGKEHIRTELEFRALIFLSGIESSILDTNDIEETYYGEGGELFLNYEYKDGDGYQTRKEAQEIIEYLRSLIPGSRSAPRI